MAGEHEGTGGDFIHSQVILDGFEEIHASAEVTEMSLDKLEQEYGQFAHPSWQDR